MLSELKTLSELIYTDPANLLLRLVINISKVTKCRVDRQMTSESIFFALSKVFISPKSTVIASTCTVGQYLHCGKIF